jgi:outer membrane protein assembly factor BamE (lipoprotein component of BamABCDE complex)
MRSALIFAAIGLAASACAPVVRQHGYVDTTQETSPVQPNMDTKETIQARMGSPSTTGVFEDTWYYISSRREEFAYFEPLITERSITAIKFNEDGTVSSVENYDVTDGKQINLVDRSTPTRGRQLSLLEQIFGSISSVGTNQLPGAIDTLPESAGGPSPY